MNMFCYQCQEAAGGKGCSIKGVCGKEPETSALMDQLLHFTKRLSLINSDLRKQDAASLDADRFIMEALFCTITNANFDDSAIKARIDRASVLIRSLSDKAKSLKINLEGEIVDNIGVLGENSEDIRSLKELVIYGVKGAAAYIKHAYNLGFEDVALYQMVESALSVTCREDISMEELLSTVLNVGECGVKAMALLDKANTTTYGIPEITKVNIGVGERPGILVSGHDLKDLEELLEQSIDSGVDIYTHSEMLPAHYYPTFKKYPHFIGNYGNAWWRQREEFESFRGVILFTTNCIVPPLKTATYRDKIYTTGSSGLAGAYHIPDREDGSQKDFSSLIEHAKRCQPPKEIERGEILGGFAHGQVMALADKVIDAVKSGSIKRFVVMAGCDGRMKEREYYTAFAKALPKDSIILTAGCAKYRYNKLEFGDIAGIPRVLDAGQCNDSYSLVMIALALKEAFGLSSVNDLPIVYNIAWYEQKAVIVLLALLSLGVKKIHLGPTLPAFLSPNVLNVLIENFEIGGISTVEEDIIKFL